MKWQLKRRDKPNKKGISLLFFHPLQMQSPTTNRNTAMPHWLEECLIRWMTSRHEPNGKWILKGDSSEEEFSKASRSRICFVPDQDALDKQNSIFPWQDERGCFGFVLIVNSLELTDHNNWSSLIGIFVQFFCSFCMFRIYVLNYYYI